MRAWTTLDLKTFDVVVVGSGAAGLVAAAAAASRGLSVAVLERSDYFGGTSAISAGTLWVPCNPYQREAGVPDSPAAARGYLESVCRGRTPGEVLDAVVAAGPEMIEFVRSECDLHFDAATDFPDYRPDFDGFGTGRALQVRNYDGALLGPLRQALRPHKQLPFSMSEFREWGPWLNFPWAELQERAAAGIVAKGNALIAALLQACRSLGVALATGVRVESLLRDSGRVSGVEADGLALHAQRGVVLACGGFEWNPQLVGEHLTGPLQTTCSPPHNTGDGLRMAAERGAALANLDQAWWVPMVVVPGEQTDGRPVGTMVRAERQGPGSIMVNRAGKRFANESQNYNDLTRSMIQRDSTGATPDLPAFVVFDQSFLERYGFLSHRAGSDVPEWIASAPTLSELAAGLDVDGAALESTVARFNSGAIRGVDPDFHRGANVFDEFYGDAANPHPNPALAPLDAPPYYGVELVPGAFGTSGGVRTDGRARALDLAGAPIPGLYTVGNASAHPTGAGYPGAGGTLGPAMTMGYLAGRDLALG
ncbi:FAD-dependent oxidoreductase [Tomitella biformata]|uniref:FAD-dependent oxidoreductase n=1 Tax=Tomitella biformata TaxID=630403 RepID=UPI00046755D5|nr:FAD-dependent oxidoreductase [Tomitella biformata]